MIFNKDTKKVSFLRIGLFFILYICIWLLFFLFTYLSVVMGVQACYIKLIVPSLSWLIFGIVIKFVIKRSNITLTAEKFKQKKLYLLYSIALGIFFSILFYYLFLRNLEDIKTYHWINLSLYPIIASISQELYFRGLLQNSIEKVSNYCIAILVVSLYFTLTHLSLESNFLSRLAVYFVFSVLVGFLYWKTKNIIYPIMAHIFSNIIHMALLFFIGK